MRIGGISSALLNLDDFFDNFDSNFKLKFSKTDKIPKSPALIKNLSNIFEKMTARDIHPVTNLPKKSRHKSRGGPRNKRKSAKQSKLKDSLNETNDRSLRHRLNLCLGKDTTMPKNSSMVFSRTLKDSKTSNKASLLMTNFFSKRSHQDLLSLFNQKKKRQSRSKEKQLQPENKRKQSRNLPKRNLSMQKKSSFRRKGTLFEQVKNKISQNEIQLMMKTNEKKRLKDLASKKIGNEIKSTAIKKISEKGVFSGSTRVPTSSRLDSHKRTPISYGDTDIKSKSITRLNGCSQMETLIPERTKGFMKNLCRSIGGRKQRSYVQLNEKKNYYIPKSLARHKNNKNNSFAYSEELS